MVALYSGDSTILPRTYNTPSIDDKQPFLKLLLSAELSHPDWNAVYTSHGKRQDYISAVLFDKRVLMKVIQDSRVLSLHQRRRHNVFSKELGYICHQSRYTTHTNEQRIALKNEVIEAKQTLLQLAEDDRLNSAYWKSADATPICRQDMELSVSSLNIHGRQNELLLFGYDIAVQVLHEFTSIIPDTTLSERISKSVKETNLAMALFDSLIATALTCLQENGSNSVGDNRQKLYLDRFTTF